MNRLPSYLEDYLEKHELSIRAFADRCGLSDSTIGRLLRNETKDPGVDHLRRIAGAMSVPLSTLMMLWDGLDPDEPVIPNGGIFPLCEEEKEIIKRGFRVGMPFDMARDPSWLDMTPEERSPIMHMYRATVEYAERRKGLR